MPEKATQGRFLIDYRSYCENSEGLLLADNSQSSDLAWNYGLRVSCRPKAEVWI